MLNTSNSVMKAVLAPLLCLVMVFMLAHPVWAHGGGGGGGGGAGGGGGGGAGAGAGGGHGGGNGASMGVGHGSGMGFGHGSAMGFGHSSHAVTLSARSSHSHSNHATHHSKGVTTSKSVAHRSRAHHHTVVSTEVAQNETLRGKKKGFIDELPPGLELQLDRGRSLPPGWQSKVGPGTILTDTDTTADLSLPAGKRYRPIERRRISKQRSVRAMAGFVLSVSTTLSTGWPRPSLISAAASTPFITSVDSQYRLLACFCGPSARTCAEEGEGQDARIAAE